MNEYMNRINANREAKQSKKELDPNMITIDVYFRRAGNYNILETTHFGFACSIMAEGIKVINKTLTYDKRKASMIVNKHGYMTLMVKE